MKAVIFAGGLGTRIAEESENKPKPMIEIGGKPILWHIMKMYSHYGINDFIVCLGYKGYMIKEYFLNYGMHMSDLTIDIEKGSVQIHRKNSEAWKVTLVDTGESTMTGGRLKRVKEYLKDDDMFCLTYGDGLSDVDITDLIHCHVSAGKRVTVTAVTPPGRFGAMNISQNGLVESFMEKPQDPNAFINGGFFVLNKEVIDLIQGDQIMWEKEPMESLVRNKELNAYRHLGFWHPMDTLRDRRYLEELWSSDAAAWRKW